MSAFLRSSSLLAVAFGSCALDFTGPAVTSLTTDRSAYVARLVSDTLGFPEYGFTVVARFTNRTAGTLFLGRCYPSAPHPIYGIELAEPSGDPWGAAYSPPRACVGHDQQIAVAAGETREDTLHVRGPAAVDGVTHQPFGALAGAMRLVYQVQECRGDGACPSARDLGRSNSFTVRIE